MLTETDKVLAEAPNRRNRHYLDTIRRSYNTLMHVADVLEETCAMERPRRREVAETLAAFVQTLAWADSRLRSGESEAIGAIIDLDHDFGGHFAAAISSPPMEGRLMECPAFLVACGEYDQMHGARLQGTAMNALESMGLSFLAADWEITDEELDALQSLLKDWRNYLGVPRKTAVI